MNLLLVPLLLVWVVAVTCILAEWYRRHVTHSYYRKQTCGGIRHWLFGSWPSCIPGGRYLRILGHTFFYL